MEEKKSASGLAITAMILGIVSVVFTILVWILGGIGYANTSKVPIGIAFTLGILGTLLGAAGVVLAIMAKKAEDTSVISKVGLILSLVGLGLCSLSYVSCLSCISCNAYAGSVTSILNSLF